jgi:chitinase
VSTAIGSRSLPPPRRRLLAVLTAPVLALAGLTGPAATPAQAAGPLTASFTGADNGSWWKGTYIVKNSAGTPVTGWTLEFDLPPGVTISQHYNGTATVSGSHVTVTPAYYNTTRAEPCSVPCTAGSSNTANTGARKASKPVRQ